MAESLGAESEHWQIVLVIVEQGGDLVLVAEPTRQAVPCPRCGELTGRQHSSYFRRPLDLPWRGHTVRLRVHSRRWFCDVPSCPREIFAERFDGALAHYARRTCDTTDLLTTFALQAGGEGGARLARKVGVPTSPDTLLRLLHSVTEEAEQRGPRVLGVDDVALRKKQKQHRYGTLLIDLERHRPIDLLDERTAEVFADWLHCHPGVEIIVRDRAGAYAEGGKQGAPEAIQVADRFHLSANVGAALDEVLRSRQRHLEHVAVPETPEAEGPTPTAPTRPPNQLQQEQARRRAYRSARWDEVRKRRAAGYSLLRIERELGMHWRTVHRYLGTPVPPHNRPRQYPRPGGLSSPMLQPFVEYLQGRWQAGCTNIAQLKRELQAQGYRGSYALLHLSLTPWRGPRPPPEAGRGPKRGRRRVNRVHVRWLCLRPPHQLTQQERAALRNILQDDERLACGYELVQRFRGLIAHRSVAELDRWLPDAEASGLRPFVSLAHGIRADRAAVVNGLTLPWSTGPVEGTVTKVKLIKRQGYGRASTRLLKRRIICAA
jgi:transposase